MALVASLLQALQYPGADKFDPIAPAQLQSLVAWLENTKIRHYPVDGRAHLQAASPQDWEAGFQRYLADLGCPAADATGAGTTRTLEWLLSHAVALEFEDRAAECTAALAVSLQRAIPPEEWTPPQLPPFPDTHSAETQAALRAVLAALRTPPAGKAVSPEDVARARAVLESQIVPTLAEADRQPGGAPPTAAAALSGFPLGFSTGDAGVDTAATVLRLLYIKDLRALQTQIDEAIVEQQELTAHPKTDAAMGRAR